MEQTKKRRGKGLMRYLGKRNLAIVAVMLLIGLAVYLNYLWFYDPADNIGYGDNNTVGTGGDSVETGGEASDYFASVILSRESARQESIEVLQSVVNATDGEERETALLQIAEIAATMEAEANIESLVKAGGYEKCVAVISGDSASIVVSSENALDPARVAAITTIVYEQTGILPANLTVKQK